MTNHVSRFVVIAAVVAIGALTVLCLPAIPQDPSYHLFADARTFLDIPNFWNVVSNLLFLVVAIYAAVLLRSRNIFVERSERIAFSMLAVGIAAVALGSTYYHVRPNDQSLFWDRLPMTVVFMSLVAITISERIDSGGEGALLFGMIALGAVSVCWWRFSGDLRLYALVQFGSMAVVAALLLLFPSRYGNSRYVWCTLLLYVASKVLECWDHEIARVVSSGGHPLKHAFAACALFVYLHGARAVRSSSTGELRKQSE